MSQHTISETATTPGHRYASPTSAPWARGDFAVHPLSVAVPLIDGRAAMLAMCVAFLEAQASIWLAGWSIFARLRLVRGRDQRAGPDGSAEQYALLDRLRATGLASDAIALWRANGLSLVDVLGLAVRRGVDVRVLLWDPLDPWQLGHLGNDPAEQAAVLRAQGVPCRLDKNCRSPLHIAQGLHQKCAVVDGQVAFAGGIDFTVEYSGDFDRWDLSSHPFKSNLRQTELGISAHPWHDAQVMLTGPAVLDVERNVRERWDASAGRVQQRIKSVRENLRGVRGAIRSGSRPQMHPAWRARTGSHQQPTTALPQTPGAAAGREEEEGHIQIIRTIPALTYRFAPGGIYGIAQWYQQAVRRAERFIYLESQYLWVEGPPRLNFTRLGWQSRKMRALVEDLADAAERGVHIALVLPDHPNVGRAVTDETIEWLREHAPRAVAANRLRFYTLATYSPGPRDVMRYRPVYVHAKVAVIDDRWATIGSANLNSRGMSHDAELNVAIEQRAFARGLRQILWAEHTGTSLPDDFAWPVGNTTASADAPGSEMALRVQALVRAMVRPHFARPPGMSDAAHADIAASLANPDTGMCELARLADENLQRLQRGEPLAGYLLPYLLATEDRSYGLHIERHRGLLDPLREVREGVVVSHLNRYV